MGNEQAGAAIFVTVLLGFLAFVIWHMLITVRRQGRAVAQVDQSMRMQEQQLELQEEANELLRAVVNNQVQIIRLLRPPTGTQ